MAHSYPHAALEGRAEMQAMQLGQAEACITAKHAETRPTISTVLSQTERLANHLHEVVTELEARMAHFVVPYPQGVQARDKNRTASGSSMAASIEGVNETLSALIDRLNTLKHAVDL